MATVTRLLRTRLVATNNQILWSSTLKSNQSLFESSYPLAQRIRSLPRSNITTEASPEQFSATKEEAKGASGFGKQGSSGSSEHKPTSGEETCHHQSGSNGSAAETLLGMVKATVAYASPKVSMAFQRLKEVKVTDFAKKGYEIVKDELHGNPSKKRHLEITYYPSMGERSTRTDIAVVAKHQSLWSKKLDDIKEKIRSHPIYKRVKGVSDPVVVKSQEIAEDMLERWETSDSPIVHKIQDLNESIFVETDAAATSKEIRQRDPYFSLPEFIAEVQEVVRPVLNAFMKGDYKTLGKYCSPEVIQRHKAEQAAFRSHGIFFDNKILHISDVDVKETRMMGTSPIIIVSFQTQQVHCVRDKNGAITEGGKDTIHSVYYAWAMQQVDPEELGEDAINPIWRIRDMQKMGVQALI